MHHLLKHINQDITIPFGAVKSGLTMFTCNGRSANNGSTQEAQYWLLPKNMHTFFYRYALAISSMMRYHLQDFIKSEHLQIINVFAYFTISKKFHFEVDNCYFHSNIATSI